MKHSDGGMGHNNEITEIYSMDSEQRKDNISESIPHSVQENPDSLKNTHSSRSNVSDVEEFDRNSKLPQESDEVGIPDNKSLFTTPAVKGAEKFTDQESSSNIPKSNLDICKSIEEENYQIKKRKFVKKKATKKDIRKGKNKIEESNLAPIKEEKDKLSDESSESHDINDERIPKQNDLSEFSTFIVNPFKGEKSKKLNVLDTQSNFEEYTGYDEEGALPKDKLDKISRFRQEIKDKTKGYMINLRIIDYLDLVDKYTKAIE
jgi:hypothetical protein